MSLRSTFWHLISLGFVPRGWRLIGFASLGIVAGLGLAVAHVSRAPSYLSDDPETCANCHVMNTAYATWQRSSHRLVTVCNDCHVPHDNLVHKLAFKAQDGLRHSSIFALRLEPQVIHVSDAAVPVIEANCRHCHAAVVDKVHLREYKPGDPRCWDCHRDVPHGTVRSLSAAPRVMAPELPGVSDFSKAPTIGGKAPRQTSDPSTQPDDDHDHR